MIQYPVEPIPYEFHPVTSKTPSFFPSSTHPSSTKILTAPSDLFHIHLFKAFSTHLISEIFCSEKQMRAICDMRYCKCKRHIISVKMDAFAF